MIRTLILGGTADAGQLIRQLPRRPDLEATLSLAGRTQTPLRHDVPTRIGGFGGVQGLMRYIAEAGVDLVIDATHPFAAQMSAHAIAACGQTGTALVALERAPWREEPGDRWTHVADSAAAVAALPEAPTRVFLGTGRQTLHDYAARPQHFYLARVIDPPGPVALPRLELVFDRGPFTIERDIALLQAHAIEIVVTKNAGGEAARAKIDAARHLALPVIIIDRPAIAPRERVETIEELFGWLDGHFGPFCSGPSRSGTPTKRGV